MIRYAYHRQTFRWDSDRRLWVAGGAAFTEAERCALPAGVASGSRWVA